MAKLCAFQRFSDFAVEEASTQLQTKMEEALARINGGWRAELAGIDLVEDWSAYAAGLIGSGTDMETLFYIDQE